MGSVSLIAKVPFLYASRSLAIGDLFDASEQDAKILTHIGHASTAPIHSWDGIDRSPLSKDMTAEASSVKVDRRTRAYRRRDLVPEP